MKPQDSAYHLDTGVTQESPLPTAVPLDIEEGEVLVNAKEKCPIADPLVFTSLDTHFSATVFLEQFLFHIFFPLSVIYGMGRYGTTHAQVQQYHLGNRATYFTTIMPFLCMATAVYCVTQDRDNLNYKMLVVPFMGVFLQRMMIAVKYATLSPDEYTSFLSIGRPAPFCSSMSRENIEKAQTHMKNMQLLSGWIMISDDLIKHELVVSSLRQGIDLRSLFFYIPATDYCYTREANVEKMVNDWKRIYKDLNLRNTTEGAERKSSRTLLKPSGWGMTADDKYMKVLCQDVLEYMIHVMNKSIHRAYKYVLFFIALLDAFIVWNYLEKNWDLVEKSTYTKMFYASTAYLLGYFCPVIFGFCVSALADVYRRYQFSRMLKELITVSDVAMVDTKLYGRSRGAKQKKNESVQLYSCSASLHGVSTFDSFGKSTLPRIDMSMPANYISWCMCRQVLTGFGKRFLNRTDLYIGVLVLLTIFEMLFTLKDMFFSSLSTAEVCGSYSFSQVLITLSVLTVIMCFLMIGIYMTNRHMSKHRIQISMHLLHANRAMHALLFGKSIEHKASIFQGSIRGNSARHAHVKIGAQKFTRERPKELCDTQNSNETKNKEEAIDYLQECIESANSVLQTVIEADDVQPLKLMNMHVEKEYIASIVSSVLIYGIVLYNYCQGSILSE